MDLFPDEMIESPSCRYTTLLPGSIKSVEKYSYLCYCHREELMVICEKCINCHNCENNIKIKPNKDHRFYSCDCKEKDHKILYKKSQTRINLFQEKRCFYSDIFSLLPYTSDNTVKTTGEKVCKFCTENCYKPEEIYSVIDPKNTIMSKCECKKPLHKDLFHFLYNFKSKELNVSANIFNYNLLMKIDYLKEILLDLNKIKRVDLNSFLLKFEIDLAKNIDDECNSKYFIPKPIIRDDVIKEMTNKGLFRKLPSLGNAAIRLLINDYIFRQYVKSHYVKKMFLLNRSTILNMNTEQRCFYLKKIRKSNNLDKVITESTNQLYSTGKFFSLENYMKFYHDNSAIKYKRFDTIHQNMKFLIKYRIINAKLRNDYLNFALACLLNKEYDFNNNCCVIVLKSILYTLIHYYDDLARVSKEEKTFPKENFKIIFTIFVSTIKKFDSNNKTIEKKKKQKKELKDLDKQKKEKEKREREKASFVEVTNQVFNILIDNNINLNRSNDFKMISKDNKTKLMSSEIYKKIQEFSKLNRKQINFEINFTYYIKRVPNVINEIFKLIGFEEFVTIKKSLLEIKNFTSKAIIKEFQEICSFFNFYQKFDEYLEIISETSRFTKIDKNDKNANHVCWLSFTQVFSTTKTI